MQTGNRLEAIDDYGDDPGKDAVKIEKKFNLKSENWQQKRE